MISRLKANKTIIDLLTIEKLNFKRIRVATNISLIPVGYTKTIRIYKNLHPEGVLVHDTFGMSLPVSPTNLLYVFIPKTMTLEKYADCTSEVLVAKDDMVDITEFLLPHFELEDFLG